MDVADKLRTLREEILSETPTEDAFQTWQELRLHLSTDQRVEILTAWNQYLRLGKERELITAIGLVIREVESE